MRYFTIEQRESLRNALTHRAMALRGEIANNLRKARVSTRTAWRVDDLEDLETGDALLQEDIQQLKSVKETLVRLRSPDYGICTECECDIPFARLRDDPFANLCRQCQQRNDLAQFVPNEM